LNFNETTSGSITMKNQNFTNGAALAGRVLLALIFVLSGFNKITGFEGTAGYMASMGIPLAKLFLVGTIAMELGGGLLLMLGWRVRWVAAAFVLFLIPVTVIFHGSAPDPAQAQAQFINFMKNLSIMGGMLQVVAFGAGAWSLDGRRKG
jgi:putative oxidoreductase